MADESYTPEEVAKILKISKYTVYELIKRGDLNGYRVGRKVRVEAPDLEIFKKKAKGFATDSGRLSDQVTEAFFPADQGLIICGQDIVLDIMTRHLEKQMPHVRFLRQYIGSIDGLMALYRGKANVVTAHLWDSDTDDYNVSFVRRILPGQKTVVINLVYRIEGLYVAKGNPKELTTWADLAKPGIRFVNRERGSGARVLLDEKLSKLNLDPSKIQGYDREEMSHLAVASCVARGVADVGLGIEKAATQVKDIDFLPLQKERYDLVVYKSDLEKPHFQAMLAVLQSESFRHEIAGMGGYDISLMGKIISGV